jgi:xanthine dehydrogenase YagT iron-sulfur-binding subunit
MKQQESNDHKPEEGMTRRGFIKSVGAGAAAAAATGTLSAVAAGGEKEVKAEEMQKLTLRVNGRAHRLLVEPRWSLLFVLREKMGLTGTKVGCERGECGACTVLINQVPRYACMTLALEAEGEEITTVEGLMEGEELGPVQQAFVEHDAFQCGYCTPGQIVAAEGLLRANPRPTAKEIQEGMGGNLCRCGAYAHIFQAVDAAATGRNAAATGRNAAAKSRASK